MQSGGRGGFRIISFVETERSPHVLYPLLIYAKVETKDVTAVEVAEAVHALRRELATPPIDALPEPGMDEPTDVVE